MGTDRSEIEVGVNNALAEQLPDLTPLFRAAYIFELQEVEKRLDALASKDTMEATMEALWQRRHELLETLWPSLPGSGGED